ncbi:uncharacterized protein ARMOST_06957 [Armillaria ostoyae]|uniref:Reverse transcriptase domain-containing protein n=1 Tax=Armillaria ostoyae TaxID=47428 RepID=A0A284R4F6_ARMOS|nr:uncharacterized protein ARMOST_06957 [Armillaria ostoyae]
MHLASLGGRMPEYLGQWLWKGFKKDSNIYTWFSTLTIFEQDHMCTNIVNFLTVIKEDFLGDQWQILMNNVFEAQRFRQRGHENESPQGFITRRTMYTCMLTQVDDGSIMEVNIIMCKAPIAWRPILNMATINSTKQLLAQVIEHNKALVLATRSDSTSQQVNTNDLISALCSIGIEPPRRSRFATPHTVNLATDVSEGNGDEGLELAGVDELLETVDSDEELEGSLLRSVYQVLKKRQRPPPKKYFFPVSHQETKLGKPPPSPCKVCSSPKHWDRECPHWDKYLKKVKARNVQIAALQVPPETSPDEAYQAAYQAVVLEANKGMVDSNDQGTQEPSGFQMASRTRQGSESSLATESKTTQENEIVEVKTTLISYLEKEEHQPENEITEPEKTGEAYIASLPRPMEMKPIKLNPKWKTKEGLSAAEILVLAIEGWVGNMRNKKIYLRHDSCADLTDKNAEIEGYVQLPIFAETINNELVETEVEAYVVPGMSVPILLGEDYQTNFEIGVSRTVKDGCHISYGNDDQFTVKAIKVDKNEEHKRLRASVYALQKFIKAKNHRRQKNRRARKKKLSLEEEHTVRAVSDVKILPHSSKNVEVSGPFEEDEEWLVERNLVMNTATAYLVIPNMIINSKQPTIPMANPTSSPKLIRKGEALGIAHKAQEFFDSSTSSSSVEAGKEKLAMLISRLVELEEAVRQPGQEGSERETDDYKEYGPKMAAMPELESHSANELRSLLDVGDLPEEFKEQAWSMLERHVKVFGFNGRLGNHPTKVRIRTKEDAQPISLPMYASSPAKREVIDKQIDVWYEKGIIEPSKSPWGAPIVIAYRNNKPRFCIDYRRLNAITIPDEFPIPRQTEILAALSGAQVLSSLDALAGFTQLDMHEDDIEKTVFRSHRGLFQFKRMPFGLRNGPSIFQQVMQGVLAPYLWIFSLVYIDDIVVYSRTFEEHIKHLDQVLSAIEESGITLSPTKCHLFYSSILLLGHKVLRLGLSTHEEKVQAI